MVNDIIISALLTVIIEVVKDIATSQAFAAFLGSFTAFIFGILTYIYTKRRERYKEHYDALVKAEHILNRHLNDIAGNIYMLESAADTMNREKFTHNEVHTLDLPELMMHFLNVPLINAYLDYETLVEKINSDFMRWNKMNERLLALALAHPEMIESINLNRQEQSRAALELAEYTRDLLELCYYTGAYVRRFMAVDKRDFWGRFGATNAIDLTPREVEKERQQLIRESKETMKRDREGRLKRHKTERVLEPQKVE